MSGTVPVFQMLHNDGSEAETKSNHRVVVKEGRTAFDFYKTRQEMREIV